MEPQILYQFAADIILITHLFFVALIIFGLLLILAGNLLRWSWVRNPWFRLIHLVAIGVVVLQSWLEVICPLTTWEMALRSKAGDTVYAGSFISHWLQNILYYQAPEWVFTICYTLFGLLVAVSWYWVRPYPFRKAKDHGRAKQNPRKIPKG